MLLPDSSEHCVTIFLACLLIRKWARLNAIHLPRVPALN